MSTLFFLLFFGFIAYRIITGVMGPGFDVGEEARKKLEARRQAGSAQQQRAAPARTPAPRAATATRSSTGPSRQPVPSRPAPSRSSSVTVREEDEFDWYVTLDVPPDASRREILEAVRRRLEVARSIGDTTAPARIARAAAQSMKLRSGTAGTFGRRQ